MISSETVVDLTKDFRDTYIDNNRFETIQRSYVISIDGSGDPVIINNEGQVEIYYHDVGESEILAESFEKLIENNFIAG